MGTGYEKKALELDLMVEEEWAKKGNYYLKAFQVDKIDKDKLKAIDGLVGYILYKQGKEYLIHMALKEDSDPFDDRIQHTSIEDDYVYVTGVDDNLGRNNARFILTRAYQIDRIERYISPAI